MAFNMKQVFYSIVTDSGDKIILDAYAVQDRFDASIGLPLTTDDPKNFVRWSERHLGINIWETFFGSLGGMTTQWLRSGTYHAREVQWNKVNTAVSTISQYVTPLSKLNGHTFTIGEHLYRLQEDSNIIEININDNWYQCFGVGAYPSSSGGSQASYQRFAAPVIMCTDVTRWKSTILSDQLGSGLVFGLYGNIYNENNWQWDNNLTANIYIYHSNQYTVTFMTDLLNSTEIDVSDPAYAGLDPSNTGGGYDDATYNGNSDDMPSGDQYNTSITNGGFLSLFTPSDNDMVTLSNYLWSNSFTDTIKSVFDKIGSLGLSFQDYILSLHRLPVPVTAGASKIVQLGWYPTTVSFPTAGGFGGVYTLGTITIPKYYGNALDYKSRLQIYLPYIGFEDLDTQAVIGKPLTLKYVVDYVSGDCQAQLFVDGQMQYQFKGNMAYHLPVGQDNFGDIIQQGISIGASMVTGGSALAAGADAAKKAMDSLGPRGGKTKASNMYTKEAEYESKVAANAFDTAIDKFTLNVGGDITRGGAVGGNSGWFACQLPFVIINRPRISLPSNFGHYHGYPSNITERLGNLSGYTRVSNIHLENIGCTGNEEVGLDGLLKRGVIIRSFTGTAPSSFTLYRNNSDANTIGKDLTLKQTISDIKLKDETSMESPTFLLSGIDSVVNDINYLYYPEFGRYYFIDEITNVRNGLWAIHCTVDVLESFKSAIANQTAVISRQENKFNLYLDDGTLSSYANAMVQTLNFPTSFNDLGSSNILVILGS